MADSIYDFKVTKLDGSTLDFAELKEQVLLIVNTASQCGFTPQYKELEELHHQYNAQGLKVIAFPCNQFGQQEPGSAADIGSFCELNYQTSFTLCDKIDVNGPNAAPLYQFLKRNQSGILGTQAIKWNFTKFLVAKDGRVLERYGSVTKPLALKPAIEAALAATV